MEPYPHFEYKVGGFVETGVDNERNENNRWTKKFEDLFHKFGLWIEFRGKTWEEAIDIIMLRDNLSHNP